MRRPRSAARRCRRRRSASRGRPWPRSCRRGRRPDGEQPAQAVVERASQDHAGDAHVQARERRDLGEGVRRGGVGEQVRPLGHVQRLGVAGPSCAAAPRRLRRRSRTGPATGSVVAGDAQDPHPQRRGDEDVALRGSGSASTIGATTATVTSVRTTRTAISTQAATCVPSRSCSSRRGCAPGTASGPTRAACVARGVEDVPALQVVVAEVDEVVGQQAAPRAAPRLGHGSAARRTPSAGPAGRGGAPGAASTGRHRRRAPVRSPAGTRRIEPCESRIGMSTCRSGRR